MKDMVSFYGMAVAVIIILVGLLTGSPDTVAAGVVLGAASAFVNYAKSKK